MNLIQTIITASIVIIGWFVVSYLNSRRELGFKKKEFVTNYLISAYRILADIPYRPDNESGFAYQKEAEKAIRDVQLFGSAKLIELANKFTQKAIDTNVQDYGDLLYQMRKELRKELKLSSIPDEDEKYKIVHFRMYPKKDMDSKLNTSDN